MLRSMDKRDYEQELGILQPLLRLNPMSAIQERAALSKSSTPCLHSTYRAVNHEWITSHWLPSLGLTQYSNIFRQCCVDGMVLEHLSKKELRTSLGMVESSHRNRLQ
ncbi:Liprin alpha [Oopsacas minuta]|uniref:Liprin alpha n=1 Tax=Oopsacas minuta TaxID=111878 RepID=A0AAV7KCM9_9METZ|nr:Liprin alpha [Oopsacas minuta]